MSLPAGANHESFDAAALARGIILLLLHAGRETLSSLWVGLCDPLRVVYDQPRQVVLSCASIPDAVRGGVIGGRAIREETSLGVAKTNVHLPVDTVTPAPCAHRAAPPCSNDI